MGRDYVPFPKWVFRTDGQSKIVPTEADFKEALKSGWYEADAVPTAEPASAAPEGESVPNGKPKGKKKASAAPEGE